MNHSCITDAAIRSMLLLACWTIAGAAAAQHSCDASIGTSVAFGIYDATSGSASVATTNASLTCTHLGGGAQKIDWDMQLTNGGSGSCAARRMAGPGGDFLNYNIYVNNIAGGVWGNAGCGAFPSGQIQVTSGQPVQTATRTLFGQLPTGQLNAGAGVYTDALTLTITFN